MSVMNICFFAIIPPWKRVLFFILTKFKSPSPKNALCQVWLVPETNFKSFLLFCNFLPMENVGLPLNKFEFLSPKDEFCNFASLVKIGQDVVLEKKKMWDVYDDDDANDNGDERQTHCAISSLSIECTFSSPLPNLNTLISVVLLYYTDFSLTRHYTLKKYICIIYKFDRSR